MMPLAKEQHKNVCSFQS